jgi:predicted DNA-binding transcriptional regulator AlpA
MKSKRSVGRPLTYDKDYHPKKVVELMNEGLCIAQVCRAWGISRETFYAWAKDPRKSEFSDALKIGETALEASFVDLFHDLATGKIKGSAAAAIFMSKNVVKWSEKFELHESDDVEFEVT